MRKDVYDYVGKKFGHLTVLAPVGVNEHGETLVYCECDCEHHTNKVVRLYKLLDGSTVTCAKPCHRARLSDKDVVGKKYGRLTIIGISHREKGRLIVNCQCECGNNVTTYIDDIRYGNTKSCGCYHREKMFKHGKHKERIYGVWAAMKARCYEPNNVQFKNYGGRGISVCDEWKNDFVTFYEWAVSNGYDDSKKKFELTLDRIDVNKDYSPNNCRFVNMSVQNRNRRNNIWAEYNGEKHILKDWSDILGINYSTLQGRYRNGDRGERLFRKVKTINNKERS